MNHDQIDTRINQIIGWFKDQYWSNCSIMLNIIHTTMDYYLDKLLFWGSWRNLLPLSTWLWKQCSRVGSFGRVWRMVFLVPSFSPTQAEAARANIHLQYINTYTNPLTRPTYIHIVHSAIVRENMDTWRTLPSWVHFQVQKGPVRIYSPASQNWM